MPVIEGSALLGMQELRVLGVAGWHIYLVPRDVSFGGSTDAKLPLTELHASAWRHEDHEVLLNAALRGGKKTVLVQVTARDLKIVCAFRQATCIRILS